MRLITRCFCISMMKLQFFSIFDPPVRSSMNIDYKMKHPYKFLLSSSGQIWWLTACWWNYPSKQRSQNWWIFLNWGIRSSKKGLGFRSDIVVWDTCHGRIWKNVGLCSWDQFSSWYHHVTARSCRRGCWKSGKGTKKERYTFISNRIRNLPFLTILYRLTTRRLFSLCKR